MRSNGVRAIHAIATISTIIVAVQSGQYTRTVCEFETLKINCLPEQSIKIVDVFYGRNSQSICYDNNPNSINLKCHSPCSAKSLVEKKCNYRKECWIEAHNEFFTDPCLGIFKYLTVSYMCLEEPYETEIACDGDSAEINCPPGKEILIHSAYYGRNPRKPCVCVRQGQSMRTMACESNPSNITSAAVNRCEGKQSCTYFPSVQEDPCPNKILKFLEVNYFCL